MNYGEFKKECKKTKFGRELFDKWVNCKIPLTWAMTLIKYHNGK